ncbi:unnamed protein product, partial [Meganyctiphanes norvegica]
MGAKKECNILPEAEEVKQVHKYVRLNLRQWGTTKESGEHLLKSYPTQAAQLEELISRTVQIGESNSALVIGARGIGKSAVVDTILNSLSSSGVLGAGLAVRLSGLLQTDDRLALKEITRQLNLENVTANKVFGSFAENLAFLLESLRSGSKETSKPVIFLLDEFDLFCHHKNQTLLYNLFDVAQSAQAPICVIGLTCRLDVLQMLEKRVKSRFSHRQIHLFPSDKFDPHYLQILKLLLKMPDSMEQQVILLNWKKSNGEIKHNDKVYSIWQGHKYYHGESTEAKWILTLCMSNINEASPYLTSEMFSSSQSLMTSEAKTNIFHGLSVLQLCLVVAMKHLTTVYEGEPFNFEMVLREYRKFSQRKSTMQSFDRPVVFKSFDQLQCLELVRPVDNSRGVQPEYRLMQMMLPTTQVSSALSQLSGVPTDLLQWSMAHTF